MRIGTIQNEKRRYSPRIGGVMVLHHIVVSSQNSYTRGWPPTLPSPNPSDATALARKLVVVFFAES